MIIVQLKGGLGNQMFQYACGKSLSLQYNSDLFVDLSFLKKNSKNIEGFTARMFELNIFTNADIQIASDNLLRKFEKPGIYNKVFCRLKLPYNKCYQESNYNVTEQLKNITPPVLLSGYWQSELFFKEYSEQIRKDFTFVPTPPKEMGVIEKITSTNSVSIHIRRGDYVTNPVAKNVLGILGKEYYQKAINIINNRLPHPFYFIFSDDIAWVKEHFNDIPNSMIIENVENANYTDMYLMSNCNHNIIANSSFSWWGAWLNNNPNKVVIAPASWYSDLQFYNPHLIPESWIVV